MGGELTRPNIDFGNTISENELPDGADLRDYTMSQEQQSFLGTIGLNVKLENLFTK